MAGNALKHVQPGDPLNIPAATFNSMIDAAAGHRARAHDVRQVPQPSVPHNTVLLVRNSSGAHRDHCEVLGIDGVLVSPSDNQDEFEQRFALDGVTPTADHAGKFVVLAEPIPSGELGRAFAAGVCPVKIDVTDTDHAYADVKAGDAAQLASGATGAACILYRQDGTGTKWAVVRIDGGAGMPTGSADYDLLYWDMTDGEWKVLAFASNNWEVLLRSGSGELAWGDPRWV